MTLRIAAAAALILGLTTLLLYLHGIGKGPWADSTKPRLIGNGEQTTRAPMKSKAAADPTMSTMASAAPTSWK